MTNLYDFLRRIADAAEKDKELGAVVIQDTEIEWIRQFLQAPDVEINFKARKTGDEVEGEPVYAQDYAIKGQPFEIYTLLTEAAMQNPVFCDMLFAASGFMTGHVDECEKCSAYLQKAREDFQNQVFDYTFKPHAK